MLELNTLSSLLSLIQVYGPEGRTIFNGEKETDGKYTFAAHMDGNYKYCFSNQMSTMTPKIVMFNLEVEDKSKAMNDANVDGKCLLFFFK